MLAIGRKPVVDGPADRAELRSMAHRRRSALAGDAVPVAVHAVAVAGLSPVVGRGPRRPGIIAAPQTSPGSGGRLRVMPMATLNALAFDASTSRPSEVVAIDPAPTSNPVAAALRSMVGTDKRCMISP